MLSDAFTRAIVPVEAQRDNLLVGGPVSCYPSRGKTGPNERLAGRTPSRRNRPWFLRHLSFQFIIDGAINKVGIRNGFAVFFGGHVTVNFEHIAVGVIKINALCHTVEHVWRILT